jgi:LCP family protein required for cell wall assembly
MPDAGGADAADLAAEVQSDEPTDAPTGRRGRRRRPRSRGRRIAVALVTALAVLVAGTAVGVYLVLDRLDGNITTVDVADRLGTARPAAKAAAADRKPVNVLLMGSDTREGQGSGFGDFGGPGRSDTTILLHIAADRQSAIAVSIPRDLWVEIPDCETDDGSTVGGYSTKFNAAFSLGGPACTIRTVEEVTDVFIDHYVVVDFTGFKRVVDALGGVPVCMEEPVDDPKSGLVLPAGVSVVKGEQALAFVRARKTLADGSDTARIARQQEFLSSMVREATSRSLLTNPVRLVEFLDATTSSLTTDPGLGSVNRLASFGRQLRGISPDDVTFVTAPSRSRGDGANVELIPEEAESLFDALKADSAWPPPPPKPTRFNGDLLVEQPDDVQVRVLNGTTTPGLATQAAEQLTEFGFTVVGIAAAESTDVQRSTILVPSSIEDYDGLRTLAAASGVRQWLEEDRTSDVLTLVVGADGVTIEPVVVPSPSPSASGTSTPAPTRPGEPRTAAERICAS